MSRDSARSSDPGTPSPAGPFARLRGRRLALPAADDPAIAGARGKVVAIPIAAVDFDPTEVAVPWRVLGERGVTCVFATPSGARGRCDPRMISGDGLGLLRSTLRADRRGREAYAALEDADEFQRPIAYAELASARFDALLLPGGHAPGMRPYLESTVLQGIVADAFAGDRIVAAICHGVLVAARTRARAGDRSVLHGRRTTALLRRQELLAWRLTRGHLADYYRTYPETVEDEVRRALAGADDFLPGPLPIRRDRPGDLGPGFVVVDGRYLSARWPGDAHRLAGALVEALARA